MHITLLLEQLFSNTPVPNKPTDVHQKPTIPKSLPVDSIELKNSTAKSTSADITNNTDKNNKSDNSKINTDIPVIYDTVEFSDNAIDYANKISLGGMNIADNSAASDNSSSKGGKSQQDNSSFDAMHTVIISIGILMIVLSLFLLPKGLILTAIGAIISIYGLCRYSK